MFATQTEIDAAIDELTTTLAMPKGMDAASMERAYNTSMDGFSSSVLKETVRRICRGEFEGVNARFMPMGPELAQLLRKVEREAVTSATFKAYKFPQAHELSPFERLRLDRQRHYAGWELVDQSLSLDDFGRNCKKMKYPVGSKWVPMLNGNVYAPPRETGQGNGQTSSTGEEGVGGEA